MTPQELRDWRKAHSMTQDQAATWVGVSRRQWIRFEQGDVAVPKWLRIIVTVVPASIALQKLNEREAAGLPPHRLNGKEGAS